MFDFVGLHSRRSLLQVEDRDRNVSSLVESIQTPYGALALVSLLCCMYALLSLRVVKFVLFRRPP